MCQFSISEVRKQKEYFEELLDSLNDDRFIFKKQYLAVRQFFMELSTRQKNEDDNLLVHCQLLNFG